MEANELMIGDWLFMGHDSSIPNKVTELKFKGITEERLISFWNGSYGITNTPLDETIKPIPLTPEILEKNSFEEYGANIYWHPNIAPEKHVMLQKTPADEDWYGMVGECASVHGFTDIKPLLNENAMPTVYHGHFKYVHELQHALRLAGIKKEIVL